MKMPRLILALGLALPALVGGSAGAQTRAILDEQIMETVKQFKQLDPRNAALAQRAAAMLVFPQITKGGIALASEYGEGALRIDDATVDYYSIAAASVGLTAGMATHSEVILFMTAGALDQFRTSKGWSIAADTGIAVITKGKATDYDSAAVNKPILAFEFAEKGLIADLSLEGSKINKIRK